MKHYRYGNKTIREIGVSQRLSDKAEIEKYDRATERGQKYCLATIRFPFTKSIANHNHKD